MGGPGLVLWVLFSGKLLPGGEGGGASYGGACMYVCMYVCTRVDMGIIPYGTGERTCCGVLSRLDGGV